MHTQGYSRLAFCSYCSLLVQRASCIITGKPSKLKDLNVHSHILKWLTHYLSFRHHYVCVNSSSSEILPVYSEVPQGSVLGPLLFIVYVNDITMSPYKYLGAWITSTLNWSTHISEICSRARRQAGIIYHKFYGHTSSSTLLQLYLTFVRPLLEYAAPVWDTSLHWREYRNLRSECA